MKKIKKLLNIECLFYFFLIFLLICSLYLIIEFSFSLYTNVKYLYLSIPIVFIFGLFFYLMLKYIRNKKEIKFKWNLIILICINLIIKILNLILISPSIVQISDFNVHLSNAINKIPDFSNAVHFYHWALLSETFKIFTPIFGSTQYSGIIFISVISIINCLLLFYIGKLLTNNNKYAFIIAIIYTIWPANIFYTNLFSTEHLAITFILITTIIFVKFNTKFNKQKLLFNFIIAIILGICLSLLKFFKPIAIILILAGLIYIIFYEILYYKKINIKKIVCIIIIIITYNIMNFFMFMHLDNITNQKVNRNPTSFYLYMGLSKTNERLGLYSDTIVQKYSKYYKKYDHDFKKIDNQLIKELKEEYSNNIFYVVKIVKNKYVTSFSHDLAALSWTIDSVNDESKLMISKNNLIEYGALFSQIYYLIITILFIFGLMYYIKNTKNNNYIFLINLFIFGFMLLLMISETQARYKIIIYPFIAINCFYGLLYINSKFNKED